MIISTLLLLSEGYIMSATVPGKPFYQVYSFKFKIRVKPWTTQSTLGKQTKLNLCVWRAAVFASSLATPAKYLYGHFQVLSSSTQHRTGVDQTCD